jgi:probable O-glycosylation ligase (exosortase A-associated)
MAVLITAVISTQRRFLLLLRVIAFSIGFYGLKGGLFYFFTGGQYIVWGPENSFLHANNAIGLALAMNVPLLLYLGRAERAAWLRWTAFGMAALSYPAVLGTFSRGAWLTLATVSALELLRRNRVIVLFGLAGLLGILLLVSSSPLFSQRVLDRFDALVNYEQEVSAQSRFWNWEFCRRVGVAHPLGGGFDFYAYEAYEKYYPEFLAQWGPSKVWSCHSMWLTLFGEHGIAGLLLGTALILSCYVRLHRLRSSRPKATPPSWSTEAAGAIQSALAGFCVGGTFLDVAYFDLFYYLVASVIVISTIVYQDSGIRRATPALGPVSVIR